MEVILHCEYSENHIIDYANIICALHFDKRHNLHYAIWSSHILVKLAAMELKQNAMERATSQFRYSSFISRIAAYLL